MNNRLKRVMSLVISFFMMTAVLFGVGGKKADAAEIYLSMSVSSSSVDIGDLVTVTVSAYSDEYFSCDIVVNYDSSILEFYSNSFGSGNTINISGSGSAEITFKAIASGIAYVSTSSEAYNINGEQVYPAEQGVNIEVTDPNTTEETTEETTEATEATTEETTTEEESSETTEETTEDEKLSKDCSLMSLRVGSGTLSPEFSADQTSYNLTLPENTTKLDVEAVPSDDRAQYYISGNDELKNGQNTVTIVVTAENGAYRTYTIYVTVGEAEEELKFELDGKKYDLIEESINIDVPEGFTASTVTYKKHNIKCYTSANKLINIICLEDEDYAQAWFLVDTSNDTFRKYEELKSDFARYVLITKPATEKVPEGFKPAKLKLGDEEIDAYVSEKDGSYYLIYAAAVEGVGGWYLYDTKDKSFMRYADLTPEKEEEITTEQPTEEVTTEEVKTIVVEKLVPMEDKGIFTKKNLKLMLIGLAAMFIAVCIAAIVLLVKVSSLSKKVSSNMRKRSVAEELAQEEELEEGSEEDYYSNPENEENYVSGENEQYSEECNESYEEAAGEDGEVYDEASSEEADQEYASDDTETEMIADEASDETATEIISEEAAELAEETADDVYDNETATEIIADETAVETAAETVVADADTVVLPDVNAETSSEDAAAESSQEEPASNSFSRFEQSEEPKKKTEDTIGIQLEDAIDNNSNVNVPPVDEISKKEEAMRSRPYGIDSAFDIVDENDYKKMTEEQGVDPEIETTDISEVVSQLNDKNSALNAAAAAFANIKKSLEESETETKNLTISNDKDIVFPTKDSDE